MSSDNFDCFILQYQFPPITGGILYTRRMLIQRAGMRARKIIIPALKCFISKGTGMYCEAQGKPKESTNVAGSLSRKGIFKWRKKKVLRKVQKC